MTVEKLIETIPTIIAVGTIGKLVSSKKKKKVNYSNFSKLDFDYKNDISFYRKKIGR